MNDRTPNETAPSCKHDEVGEPNAGEPPRHTPTVGERLRPPQVIRIGGRTIPMPASRWVRIALGSVLILFGLLGFLPILGFWMVPLGLLILSIDLAIVRRWRRRSAVWLERRFPGFWAKVTRWTTPSHLRGGEDRS